MIDVVPLLRDVSARWLPETDRLAAEALDRIRAEVPALAALNGPELRDALHAWRRAGLAEGFRALIDAVERERPTSEVRDVVRICVRPDVPLSAPLHGYRVSHAVAWGQWCTAAAARLLAVHEHTVTYRLHTIEHLLGRPVAQRRAELELALRLLDARGG